MDQVIAMRVTMRASECRTNASGGVRKPDFEAYGVVSISNVNGPSPANASTIT